MLQHNGKNNNKKAYFIQFSRSGNYKRTNNVRKTWHFLCPKWLENCGFLDSLGESTSGSGRWYLGAENRDMGSIHSDSCKLMVTEQCDCKNITVYPVIGWWRARSYLGKYESKIRYSLVVSLSTPKVDVDFCTPIMTEIGNVVETGISTV